MIWRITALVNIALAFLLMILVTVWGGSHSRKTKVS